MLSGLAHEVLAHRSEDYRRRDRRQEHVAHHAPGAEEARDVGAPSGNLQLSQLSHAEARTLQPRPQNYSQIGGHSRDEHH